MLTFTKKKLDNRTGVWQGDYYDFDASILGKELLSAGAFMNASVSQIDTSPATSAPLDEQVIRQIVTAHGSIEQVVARAKTKKKNLVNMAVVGKLRETYDENTEFKFLRKGAKNNNDPDFIAYDSRVEDLRSQGAAIKSLVYAVSLPDDPKYDDMEFALKSISNIQIILV